MTTLQWLAVAAALVALPLPRPGGGGWRPTRMRVTNDPAGVDPATAFVLAVAGELRAGSDGLRALHVCGHQHPVAPTTTRAAALGGDVIAALRHDARTAPLLLPVAGAWQVMQHTGAGLAGVLENIADGNRRAAEVRRTLAVELAGPRATARVMAALPVVGVGLAWMLGADPIGWLTGSPVGIACLIGGVALDVLGFRWLNRIVANVEADL